MLKAHCCNFCPKVNTVPFQYVIPFSSDLLRSDFVANKNKAIRIQINFKNPENGSIVNNTYLLFSNNDLIYERPSIACIDGIHITVILSDDLFIANNVLIPMYKRIIKIIIEDDNNIDLNVIYEESSEYILVPNNIVTNNNKIVGYSFEGNCTPVVVWYRTRDLSNYTNKNITINGLQDMTDFYNYHNALDINAIGSLASLNGSHSINLLPSESIDAWYVNFNTFCQTNHFGVSNFYVADLGSVFSTHFLGYLYAEILFSCPRISSHGGFPQFIVNGSAVLDFHILGHGFFQSDSDTGGHGSEFLIGYGSNIFKNHISTEYGYNIETNFDGTVDSILQQLQRITVSIFPVEGGSALVGPFNPFQEITFSVDA